MEKFWLQGHAINTFELNGTSFPLIYGGDAPNVSAGASGDISRFCDPGSLNSKYRESSSCATVSMVVQESQRLMD